MSVYAGSALTDLIIAELREAGLAVGDAVAPPTSVAGWTNGVGTTFIPYVVVYPILGGTLDGSMENPDEDADPIYQLTSRGSNRMQCERYADRARAVMLGGALLQTVGSRRIIRVRPDVLGGATREDDSQPSLWFSPERFRLITTPA